MKRKYFGTDGIRGRVGASPISPEFMLRMAWAIGKVLLKNGSNKVLIGRDTRISGHMLESALQAGLNAAGINVRLLGPIPTPAIAYLTKSLRAAAGIVISASHNPFYDNGIKIFNAQGLKLSDEMEVEIETELHESLSSVDAEHMGTSLAIGDAIPRYIEFCKNSFPENLSLKNLKIIVDCANGAGFYVGPSVLRELEAEVIPIFDQPNGLNINLNCGATNTKKLQKAVLKHHADIGIALDGDGDRIQLVDSKGTIINGDEILAILAHHRHKITTKEFGVVGTVMSNMGLEKSLQTINVPFFRTQVGDRYVTEALLEKKWPLGGESSGHIICMDHIATGDAIVTALQILTIMITTGLSLHRLKSVMEKYPQVVMNVPSNNPSILEKKSVKKAIKHLETKLNKRGRFLLRASGTEPLIRIMVEGEDLNLIAQLAKEMAEAIKLSDK